MTTTTHGESAKIYQFPVGGRPNASRRRDDANIVASLPQASVPYASFGSGWYHDAAIQEGDRPDKR